MCHERFPLHIPDRNSVQLLFLTHVLVRRSSTWNGPERSSVTVVPLRSADTIIQMELLLLVVCCTVPSIAFNPHHPVGSIVPDRNAVEVELSSSRHRRYSFTVPSTAFSRHHPIIHMERLAAVSYILLPRSPDTIHAAGSLVPDRNSGRTSVRLLRSRQRSFFATKLWAVTLSNLNRF